MQTLKKIILPVFIFITIILLSACAPGTHVRVGVSVHGPGPWMGPYPYPPPSGPVMIGRPVPGGYYPALENNAHHRYSTNDMQNIKSAPRR
jgi:hypothetical protein